MTHCEYYKQCKGYDLLQSSCNINPGECEEAERFRKEEQAWAERRKSKIKLQRIITNESPV